MSKASHQFVVTLNRGTQFEFQRTFDSEYDERDGAEGARDDEVDAGPSEDGDTVVLVDAEEVHHDEDDGDQHPDEAQREEELRRLEEGCKGRKEVCNFEDILKMFSNAC